MLGDTLTVTLGGSGGTARVCSKINQDSYSAEYLHRNTTDEVRVKVRHSIESGSTTKPKMDRHNVEFTQTVFASGDTPEKIRQAYLVLRNSASDDSALVSDLGEALSYWLTQANFLKVIGWES
ncbi:MAG: putative coat protein [Tuwendivirus faecivivens]|uniref:Coat protein n=1 Tax=Leviviridae sp. TaxID=2027243 RepID=A0ABY3SUX6_9VIRU|nr:MAG: putative coat protein [Leviviridae sp.]